MAFFARQSISAPITSTAELYRRVYGSRDSSGAFDLTARVTRVEHELNVNSAALTVESDGAISLYGTLDKSVSLVSVGDVIRVAGTICLRTDGKRYAEFKSITVLGHGPAPTVSEVTIRDLLAGTNDFRQVRLRAVVRDASRSPTNPNWGILGLVDTGSVLAAPILIESCGFDPLEKLIGAEIVVSGSCSPNDISNSTHPGRQFHLYGTNAIHVIADENRRLRPRPLDSIGNIRPAAFDTLGLHHIAGVVTAVWRGKRLLLVPQDGKCVQVTLKHGTPPSVGTSVEAVGFPESNFYSINLIHATWRPIPQVVLPDPTPLSLSLSEFFAGIKGLRHPDRNLQGKLVKTRGHVTQPTGKADEGLLFISDGANTIPIATDAVSGVLPMLAPGCEIEVMGICVCEIEAWHSIRPIFRSVTVVPRSQRDIRVLSRPIWWTTGRLLSVIGILLLLLAGMGTWHLVQRRTSDLLARVTTELKVAERTRLAVELHDSLAQNLTGIALEIDTARKLSDSASSAMRKHLTAAASSLKSCRDELRNCLWDLRNRALEEPTMDAAIRQTLAPHVAGIDLTVRFTVPRERLSDNTAHALLRIIRELALNGIRHGGATKIRVAGSIENNKMLFSVSDNGSGFDPETAPGFTEGHYGLVGIRERIDEFEGDFTLKSTPGKGTKATIALIVPKENSEVVKRQST